MAEPFPNPEADLDRLRSFLEKGAATSLEVLQSFRASDRADATLAEPGTLTFDVTAADLQGRVAGDEEVRVLLDLGVGDVRAANTFFVHLFLNAPEATVVNTEEDPGFAGGFSFFCEPENEMPEMACPIGDIVKTKRFNITGNLAELQAPDEPITATLVVLPVREDDATEGGVAVLMAELSLVRSVVTIES